MQINSKIYFRLYTFGRKIEDGNFQFEHNSKIFEVISNTNDSKQNKYSLLILIFNDETTIFFQNSKILWKQKHLKCKNEQYTKQFTNQFTN